jgi:hypothetical protein|tara:strand:+ start:580 stop:1527 length:948 start_codon:yes stop_codon:yes gene_type:complete
MKIDKQYCSPNSKDNGPTCLSKESLKTLIKTYNNSKKLKKDKIIYYDNNTQLELFKKLDKKMKKKTKGSGKYWFWPNIIEKLIPINVNSNLLITNIKKIEKFELKPELPNEWLKNPKEWLSNYDIDHIMFQYSNTKKFSYRYLGTFSIDFAVKDNSGRCLYSNFCNINIKDDYISKKIKYIGFITNLDKHNEPGSHWTSTFINLDHTSKSYGAYYYDSVARKTPVLIDNFLKNIKKQCDIQYPKNKFLIKYNTKQHQYADTECGMFSIIYQIRWINYLLRNKNTVFKKVVNTKDLNDKNVNILRKSLYRPNLKQL